ncbi:MAG: hypothetical protein Q8Q01_04025 [archaeon]|nr:hypothetical protein [archaeon]
MITRNGFLKGLFISHVVYLGFLCTDAIGIVSSPKINSQEELEMILTERRKLAGIEKEVVILAKIDKYGNEIDHPLSAKLGDKKYGILLGPEWGRNVNTLDHELYHIADGHCDAEMEVNNRFLRFLQYFYLHEPQAILYSTYGIKL